jgi:hypothetical protein
VVGIYLYAPFTVMFAIYGAALVVPAWTQLVRGSLRYALLCPVSLLIFWLGLQQGLLFWADRQMFRVDYAAIRRYIEHIQPEVVFSMIPVFAMFSIFSRLPMGWSLAGLGH